MAFFRKNKDRKKNDPPNFSELVSLRDFDSLIKALHNPDSFQVRKQAARALGELGDRRALDPLLNVLQDEYEQQTVRWEAAEAIGSLNDARGFKALLSVAEKSPVGLLRFNSIKAIASITDPSAAKAHVAALARDDQEIRKASSQALKKMRRNAVEALISGLEHDDGSARIRCIELLGEIADPRAMEPLMQRLRVDRLTEARQRAMKALVSIGGTSIVDALIPCLKDPSATVRTEAVRQLDLVGGEEVVDALIECLDDESVVVQRTALQVLGKSKDERLVLSLSRVAGSRDEALRKRAFNLLKDLGDVAVDSLIALMNSDQEQVRSMAVDTMALIGDKRLINPLVSALQDDNRQVRFKAAHALKSMGWSPTQDLSGAVYWSLLGRWDECAQIGDNAGDFLFEAFTRADWTARLQIAQILFRRGDQRCIPELVQMLADTKRRLDQINQEDSERSAENLLAVFMNDDSPGHSTYRMELEDWTRQRKGIDQWKESTSRELEAILETLKNGTNQNFGQDPADWKRWLEKKQAGS